MPPIIAVVGNSNSGNTTVASFLVGSLTRRGYRVLAIKHCPHGHEIDPPDTDTGRLFGAGAVSVVASSPGRNTQTDRLEGDPTLERVVAASSVHADLVIAEGFKKATVPKVLVAHRYEEPPVVENVIATVGGNVRRMDVPNYRREKLDKLADQIECFVLDFGATAETVSLMVDGEAIPLKPFPASALRGIVDGFLSSLDNIPAEPGEIHLMIRRRPDRGPSAAPSAA